MDVWEDESSAEEEVGEVDDVLTKNKKDEAREFALLETKLKKIGFEQGLAKTYDIETPNTDEAFDEGFVEGMKDALPAGELLGHLRSLPNPDVSFVKKVYSLIQTGDFAELKLLKDQTVSSKK